MTAPRFGALSFVFLLAMIWAKGGSFWAHSPYDQQTRAAQAWLKGRTDLTEKPSYLEIAEYDGKFYSSFPPTPALFEVPWVAMLGSRNTPNTAVQVMLVWLAALVVFLSLCQALQSSGMAAFYALAFFFGTQMLYLSVEARIWHQGHCFAVAFGAFSAALLFFAAGKWRRWKALGSGFCLGLATGARPDVLFSAPYFLFLAHRKKQLLAFLCGLALPLAALFAYNFARFSNPLEFGHTYLVWSRKLPNGIFSTAYLARNLFHALLNPTLHGRGTSLLLAEPVLVIAAVQFFRSKRSREEKALAGLSVLACWVPLLLHESNGWYQFGYRFGVDLIPILFLMLLTSGPRNYSRWAERLLGGILVYSVLFNIYGMMWFYRGGGKA